MIVSGKYNQGKFQKIMKPVSRQISGGRKMKKKLLAALLAASMMTAAAVPVYASEDELPSADVAEQGYDFYDQAVQYNDIREELGAVPKLDEAVTIGFATKTFENEFWRWKKKEQNGAQKCSRMQDMI